MADGRAVTCRVLLLSDTHLPVRARALQDQVWRMVDEADVVIHAGDWVDVSLLDGLEARARRLVGVAGNNDGPELWQRLGEVACVDVEGVRFAVVHETGSAAGRERRCDERFGPASAAPADVLVFGHSHIPWDTVCASGLRLLNRAPPPTGAGSPSAPS